MKQLTPQALLEHLTSRRLPFHDGYYAMYSSVYDGIVTEPSLMMVPVDDHMVHRGDGVFETFKCVAGNIYNLREHLDRLSRSAAAIELGMPCDPGGIADLVVETVRVGGRPDALVRLFLSRGPGSFGVNPYDCPSPQLYIVVVKAVAPFMERHPDGARVMTSAVPVKRPFYAAVKNCNYLPNVLMKKEAVDAGVDFVVAFDARGFLAEGATENVGIVTSGCELVFPKLDGILRGTTMMRVLDLAEHRASSAVVSKVSFRDISRDDVLGAAEFLVVGTTPNVTRVCTFDGETIGDGQPGPVFRELSRLLDDDMHHNRAVLTPVPFGPSAS